MTRASNNLIHVEDKVNAKTKVEKHFICYKTTTYEQLLYRMERSLEYKNIPYFNNNINNLRPPDVASVVLRFRHALLVQLIRG